MGVTGAARRSPHPARAVGHILVERQQVLADIVSAEATALLTARVRDALDTAQLWAAVERAHRLAIRDDLPYVQQTMRLLRPEMLTTLVWRLDATGLLTSIGVALDLSGDR